MMRERSLNKRVQALRDESAKYKQDNFRAVSPHGKKFGSSSPEFFKRNPESSDVSDDNKASNSLGYEKV